VEFFISGGDATVGFEAGEEILNPVAFAIEMLVKGGFLNSARMQGYDGDATELIHTSANGVAVVALVHDGVGGRLQMSAQERLGLVEVGDIGAGENKAERIAECVARQVDLGGQTGAGTRHGLRQLATLRIGSVSVDPHCGAIDHERFEIPLPAQSAEDRRPQAVIGPSPESIIDTFPIPKVRRQITPGRSRAQNPKDRFDAQPDALTPPATALSPGQVVSTGLNFFSSSQSPSARTNLGG